MPDTELKGTHNKEVKPMKENVMFRLMTLLSSFIKEVMFKQKFKTGSTRMDRIQTPHAN